MAGRLPGEQAGRETAALQPFVIDGIPAALPVKELHDFTALAYKYVHITAGWGESGTDDLAAHGVYADAHVCSMNTQEIVIAFVEIEHGFLAAKFGILNKMGKAA